MKTMTKESARYAATELAVLFPKSPGPEYSAGFKRFTKLTRKQSAELHARYDWNIAVIKNLLNRHTAKHLLAMPATNPPPQE